VKNDVLSVVYPEELSGQDAKFNKIYNLFAPLYDLNERIFGKLLFGIDMAEGRNQIISFLGLKPGMSVLVVSPGPGVFQKAIREKIGIDSQYVSLDLSMGMLSQCQKRNKNLNIQLVHGNAQYLPFADNSFDALFHFGGVNLFNDPQKAISEFVRVVKNGGIVSWGDEGISESYSDKRRKKIALKMNPGFSKPKPAVPETVIDVVENEVYGGLAYLVVAKKRM
jgi:ubiquinone/menaquinone biosynthesis C-methylase UbiE